jgi:methylmalonyl-CoA/ethylmalonyl-CoA epimerase
MKVERIDFVTFFVKDLDKAVSFFSELFETRFIQPYDTAVDTKETLDSLGINLAAPLTQDGPSVKLMATKGEGLASVGFKVANLNEAITELESRGVRLVGREKIGSAEYAVFHPKDTFSAMLSVIAYEERDAATAFTSGS